MYLVIINQKCARGTPNHFISTVSSFYILYLIFFPRSRLHLYITYILKISCFLSLVRKYNNTYITIHNKDIFWAVNITCFSIKNERNVFLSIFLSFPVIRICHGNYCNILRDNPRESRIFRVMLQSSLPTATAPSPTIGPEELPAFPHRNSRSPIFLMSEISICHESGSATFRLSVRQFPRRARQSFAYRAI